MKIAGLDIGSTGCKLTVFDSDGSCLGKAYRDYPVKRTKTAHEVEAQDIIDSVFEVMEEMGRRHPDIAGIGVTSFGETFVLTDKAGCPLHTAMLYTAPRGADECRALEEELGRPLLVRSGKGVQPTAFGRAVLEYAMIMRKAAEKHG